MSQDSYDVRSSQPEEVVHTIRFQGNGAAPVTKTNGPGVTVTRTGVGVIDLIWSDNPGTFLGALFGFQATTIAGVAGMTAVCGAFNATTRTLTINVGAAAAGALIDLAAAQWCTAVVHFKQTAV
jgi:hypothetical protein